jgi:hypothetical protein
VPLVRPHRAPAAAAPPCQCTEGGRAKNKPLDPPVHLLNPRPTHPTADFFSGLYVFGCFSVRGFKNTSKILLQKVHVENFFRKIDKIFDVSFSSTFLFYRVFGCFSAMGVQKHYEKRVKNILHKNRQKIQNRLFLDFCFITFLGVSRWGNSKTP